MQKRMRALCTGVATLALGGFIGIQLAGDSSVEASEAAQRDPSPTALSKEEANATAIAELQENKSDVMNQQEAERSEATSVLVLPEGVSFGGPEQFEEIDQQIKALTAGELSAKDTSDDELQTYWYEEGFFASLMAIDWKCGWLSTGINQVEAGNTTGVAETVDMLHSFTDMEYASMFPDYDEFLAESVDPLLSGDTAGAESYLPNCLPETIAD